MPTSRIQLSVSLAETVCRSSGRRSPAQRAKWLLWTGESIDAQTALQWGVVNEVATHERAVDRGIEIARRLAAKPALYRSLQKQTLNVNLRRRIIQDVPFGMALEGLTAADMPYQN